MSEAEPPTKEALEEAKLVQEILLRESRKENMAIKQNPFKKGDRVRCIDDSGAEDLVHGDIYQVSDVSSRAGEPMVIIEVVLMPGMADTWYARRFEKVEP